MSSRFIARASQRRPHSAIVAFGVALAFLVFSAGCGQAEPERLTVFPVQGKLLFKGQPAVGGVVSLHPTAPVEGHPVTPHGNIGPDGSFQLTTYQRADGAPEGEYVVTVMWYKPVKRGADTQPGPNVIPPKYTSPETSDVKVTVASGSTSLDTIQL